MNLLECYKILNIHEKASWSDVKRAYRDLAKRYHPDKNQGNPDLELRFKKINHAYKILDGHYRKYKTESTQEEATEPEPLVLVNFSNPVSMEFGHFEWSLVILIGIWSF